MTPDKPGVFASQGQRPCFPLCLLLEAVQVPENTGMIFRLAESFGVEKVYLCGKAAAPPNFKVRRASRSTVKVVAWELAPDIAMLIARLKSEGYTVIGLETSADCEDLRQFDFCKHKKIALVVGSEKYGITASTLSSLDACTRIHLIGATASLNVATAVAIALHQITAQLLQQRCP